MAELSDEEAQALGLEPKRELSDDEAVALGLEQPRERLSESHGVKRLELHKVAPDTSDADPEPEKGKDEQLLDLAKAYLSPKSTTGAFAEGATKGVTLGFGDELYGAIDADSKHSLSAVAERQKQIDEQVADAKRKGTFDTSAGAPDLPSFTSWQLKREGRPTETATRLAKAPNEAEGQSTEPWAKAYRNARDSLRADFDTAEKEHPVAFGAGEFIGSAAVPLPGPGKAKGLAKVGKYALQGAGVGAVAGLGNSKSDIMDGEAGGAFLDTLGGAAGGGLFGAGMGGVAAKVDPALERMAARKAYKALDPYMKTIQANLHKELGREASPAEVMDAVERLGRRALDEGVIPEGKLARWATSETLGNRAATARDEAGVLKGGFTDMAQDALASQGTPNPVSMGRLATQVEAEAERAALDPDKQELARKLAREARGIRQAIVNRASAGFADPAAMTLPDAEGLKTNLQRAVYGLDVARRGGPTQTAKEVVARLAKEQAERAIEQGLGPDELAQFQALKGKYGDLAKIAQTAGHGALRDFRNQSAGFGDKLAAEVGAHAATGAASIPAALAAGAAHHIVNKRGASALARTLSNASQGSDLLSPAVEKLSPWTQFLHEDEDKKP